MKIEAAKRLKDISDACAAVGRFSQARDFVSYQGDEMLRAAVERKLEIIGEAFTKLEDTAPEVSDKFPDLRKIVGLRNRIIHGYDSVDEELIWDVVKNKLPALQRQVDSALELNA